MSSGKKSEKDLIAEFDEMLRDHKADVKKADEKPLTLGSETRSDLTKWLRPFMKHKMGSTDDDQVDAVNVCIEPSADGKSGIVKVLVFSGVSLPSLPTTFWIKNKSAPFLCESGGPSKWHEGTVRVLKQDEASREIMTVPYFYMEKSVSIVSVDPSKLQVEFEKSVMEIGEHEPHLKLLLCESVYNMSRQEEFKAMVGLKNPESLSSVFKAQYQQKMKEWDLKLKQKTPNQIKHREDFFVSNKDLSQSLLSQDQVNELLSHALKKSS
ncbi:hypothetical protein AZI86_05680 [Bdellovibrio bacteriovorus]|uniref:Uncharacterized protein n=1 Tax=Bdellovibrio bacteriovorus TaxID=959 RepID=A0A150WQQ6_BDEBC|nr:hypothetical protein [Bdellovibrio bacteriovorus]KYG66535.1 hypothetical protein AZI86_05680 [Bdellovibrio bacteriovorus]